MIWASLVPAPGSTATRLQPNGLGQGGTGWDGSLSVTSKTALSLDSLGHDGMNRPRFRSW
jgi:hypothetical protein